MAARRVQPDRFNVAASLHTTPTVTQQPLWAFRHPFNPKSWSSGTTSHSPTWSSPSEEMESPSDSLSSSQLAAMLQRQFDEEDRLLAAQRAELAAEQQRVFDCGVCMDTLPEDSMARIEPCGHPFCRECVRGFIVSQIESRRYPVLCPTCTAGPGNSRPESIGKVTRNLLLDIGTTEEQYETWVEMEMTELLVLLQCRRCGRSSYFDREEFNEARNLYCPLEGCTYIWCKGCQQEITADGPEHSCDGTSELKHLVQQQGWKFCPTCNTPCEKISGCNFLSCISPGCNTHFCYKCNELIVRSAVPTAIAGGKSEHFRKCTL